MLARRTSITFCLLNVTFLPLAVHLRSRRETPFPVHPIFYQPRDRHKKFKLVTPRIEFASLPINPRVSLGSPTLSLDFEARDNSGNELIEGLFITIEPGLGLVWSLQPSAAHHPILRKGYDNRYAAKGASMTI